MSASPDIIAKRPLTPEHDLAGVVVDANGTEFSVGDEVIGYIPVGEYYYSRAHTILTQVFWTGMQIKTGQGALTEYTKLPATHLVLKPSNVSAIEACGLPVAGETALQAIVGIGKLQAGQSVFINGGSSAVGMNAIYIAKALGAKVVTSASSRNEEFCRNAGADEVSAFPFRYSFANTSPVPRLYQETSS
jgi:NADPH:quinone reductase-like Zn-dependent oxidoreductase